MTEIITDENVIQRIYIDPATNLKLAEDMIGKYYLVPEFIEVPDNLIFLQASVSAPWPDTTNFYPIPGMVYTGAKELNYIIAISDKEAINTIAVYVNNVLHTILPFYRELNFSESIVFNVSDEIKLMFKPPVKKMNLTVSMSLKV